ncbi:MAG: hypothetical protein N2C14_17575, partial [Planctomycetales bacterium]
HGFHLEKTAARENQQAQERHVPTVLANRRPFPSRREQQMISSRTPEGEPLRCPVCQAEFQVDPCSVFGDAPCPACGCLFWFLREEGERRT